MSSSGDFRQGAIDIVPIVAAAIPIGLLWGTLAAGKGFTPFEAGLTSAAIFAGASQFIAIDQWKEPVPWLALAITVFIVNLRHILMGASLSRHMGNVPKALLFFMSDEVWALSERRALKEKLTLSYYLGLALPVYTAWTLSSGIGAYAGRAMGDPAAYGFDFAFSAMFIGIIAGFWTGSKTGAVLAASAIAAAIAKVYTPGAWFIVIGGLAGSITAAILHRD